MKWKLHHVQIFKKKNLNPDKVFSKNMDDFKNRSVFSHELKWLLLEPFQSLKNIVYCVRNTAKRAKQLTFGHKMDFRVTKSLEPTEIFFLDFSRFSEAKSFFGAFLLYLAKNSARCAQHAPCTTSDGSLYTLKKLFQARETSYLTSLKISSSKLKYSSLSGGFKLYLCIKSRNCCTMAQN